MKRTTLIVALLAALLSAPLNAAENDAKAREQFTAIIDAFNTRSFEKLLPALDQTDLVNRVVAVRPVNSQVRERFNQQFASITEVGFRFSLHNAKTDTSGELLAFEFENGLGRGVMRVKLPRHEYAYLVFDLRHDRRSRLKIVDWFDSRIGQTLTMSISELLVALQPTKADTRALLALPNPTDLQLFQVTEMLKAARDSQPSRFFDIYDGFDEDLKSEPVIAKLAMRFAAAGKDSGRFAKTLDIYIDAFGGDDNYAFVASNYFMQIQAYDRAFASLEQFHRSFDVQEGAIPARLSALALAVGRFDDAEKYAIEATTDEPSLELSWWSLLRARSGAGNYEGSIEALTYLEDNFGQRLDAAKLKRDPFRAFNGLAASEAFTDWRAARQ